MSEERSDQDLLLIELYESGNYPMAPELLTRRLAKHGERFTLLYVEALIRTAMAEGLISDGRGAAR